MATAVKEYKTLGELLKDKKQDEYYPGLAKSMAANDIKIPHLSRKIHLDEVVQLDQMQKQYGGWAASVGGSRKKQGAPVLTVETPKGGFNFEEKGALAQFLKDAGPELPAALADNFPGLTDIEARKALNRERAIGARVADHKSDPDLDQWLTETSEKLGVPKPRLIIMESDIPSSFIFSPPRVPSSIFISDDMLRIMTPSQVKAVLGHEMDHYKDHYNKEQAKQKRGMGAIIASAFYDVSEAIEATPYKKEYKADLLGEELSGNMGEMEQALLRMHFRSEDLAHFSDKVTAAFKADKVDLKMAPKYLVMLTEYPHAEKDVSGRDPDKYFGVKEKDTHPPLDWRRRNLNNGQSNPVGIS